MSHKPFYIQQNNLYIVPVCHYRFEFAWYVNRAIREICPSSIAVELPSTLGDYISIAVKRFPYLSVVFYQNGRGDYIYFPVEPTDPLCEAVRTGMELNIPFHFVDLDVDEYPLFFDYLPDSYSIYIIGLEQYWRAYLSIIRSEEKCTADERRETYMAYSLQKLLKKDEKVVFVCAMTHVRSILNKIKVPQIRPVGKVFRKDIRVFNLSPDSIREVTGETPFNISVYEMMRGKHKEEITFEIEKIDDKIVSLWDRKKKPSLSVPEEKTSEDKRNFPDDFFQKEEKITSVDLTEPPVVEIPENKYADFMNKLMKLILPKLNKLEESDEKPSLNLWDLPGPAPYKMRPENIHRFLTSEDRREELMKFYRELASPEKDILPDRQKLIISLVKRSAVYYQENTGEEIKPWQFQILIKFARNYSMVTGGLMPDFFQLITCGRSVADDNYAYEIWDLGSFYPWIDRRGHYETIDIRTDEVWLYGKKIMLRRKFPRLRKIFRPVYLKDRKKEKSPGEWTKDFDGLCICSYPPEDVIIEDYGLYLKKKGKNMLSEEQARVIPFSSSLLDGIDVKETIRNWHQDKKIFVKEARAITGGVGSVVLIFDEDLDDVRYPWKTTWQGEHGQESDMAFYATRPADKIVGPGICRCEYGGFMMSYPPMRVWDIWSDPFYDSARTKAETLLMSAVEYSLEQHIVYVAAKPPRSWFQSFAGRLNKKVKYIPLGTLSPVTLKKIKVFHVLSKHQVREYAKDYIW